MNTEILFEDDDLLVVNKPAGVTVNTSDTTKDEVTLQNWVEQYLQLPSFTREQILEEKKTTPEGFESSADAFKKRAGIVHRLDKETSGVILIAKTLDAFTNLQSQFKSRTIEKSYLALAHGNISPKRGEISVPVGRLPWNRKHFGVLPGGKEATTGYEVGATYKVDGTKEIVSLVRLYPKTGRTHQIRVHLQYLHHPIFADFLYAGRKTARNDRKLLSRVFLHASTITFYHPKTENKVTFEADLPDELGNFLQQCSILEKGGE